MPINQNLRNLIDTTIVQNQSAADFEKALSAILEDLFSLATTAVNDVIDTSAYLAYRISSVLMRSSNFALQGDYAQAASSAFGYIYNSSTFPAFGTQVAREIGLELFRNLYNFHTALVRNGMLATPTIDTYAPLMALSSFVGTTYGPPNAIIRIHSQLPCDHRIRLIYANNTYHLEIGAFNASGSARNIKSATWNMQGESGDNESKWTTYVAQLATRNDFVFLQEAGAPPASAQLVAHLHVVDQFGIDRTVDQYRWNIGTSSRPQWYHIYFYDVGRVRVNLAIVTPETSPLTIRDVIIISDGPGNPDQNEYRPFLGVRVQGVNSTDISADTTLYSFHAISGGGANAPRMVREVSWHSETNYAVFGDFNRDPRVPDPAYPLRTGNWISPPGIARIDEAAADTHPGTNPPQTSTMLDYAVSSGNSTIPAAGTVTNMQTSDHYSVEFVINFPS